MPPGPSPSAPNLLVVDPDGVRRGELVSMLAAEGARVAASPNAQDAMRLVATRRFDAAVIDLGLSGTAGIVLVAQFRGVGNGRNVPVLLLHSLCVEAERARAEDRAAHFGGVRLLARPVSAAQLAAAVNELTSRV